MRSQSAWFMGRWPGPFFLSAILLLVLLPPLGCGEGLYYGPYPQLLFLNPLHSEDVLIYEPDLIGRWQDPEGGGSFSFSGNGDQTGYRLEISFNLEEDRSISIPFTAHLVSLKGQKYLDLELKEDELDLDERYRELFLPVHWLYRVGAIGQTLVLESPDFGPEGSNSLGSYLQGHPEELDFVIAGSLREGEMPQDSYTDKDGWPPSILVTAQTGDLQRFIMVHQGDEDELIFDASIELERVRADP